MKINLKALLCVLTLLPLAFPHAASAGGKAGGGGFASSYLTLEGTSVAFSEHSANNQHNPWGMRVRLGMPVAPLLDLEGHLGFSANKGENDDDEISTSFGGVYLKAYLPLGFNSALYGLGGFSSVNITQTIDGKDYGDRRVGFSYGAGLETKLSERADLTADYVRYMRSEGAFDDVSAISFGIKFYF